MKVHRLVNSIAVFALILSSLATTGFTIERSPFVGIWRAIDFGDGSLMRVTILGPVQGPFLITWTESYFTFCDGRAGAAAGKGTLDPANPNSLSAHMRLKCFLTGDTVEWDQTWEYRSAYDDLLSQETAGVLTIWKRLSQPIVPRATFTAYLPGAAEGYDWPMGHTITLSVPGRGYSAQAVSEQQPGAAEGETRVLFEVWQDDFAFEAGDHAFMSDEAIGLTKDVLVTNLAVTGIDLATATVTGTFDPAYGLWVWLYDGDGQIPSTEGDIWTATFDELPPGAWGGATQWDVDGDGTSIDFQVPNPRISVFPESEYVEGWQWPDGTPVVATIEGETGCIASGVSGHPEWDPNELFVSMTFPQGCDVAAGMTVTLAGGGVSRTYTVQALTITSVDAEANVVAGTADDGAEVHVWVHDFGDTDLWDTTEGGAWEADYGSLEFDLQEGMCGRAEITDEAGNATAVDWCIEGPPPPSSAMIVASTEGDWFWMNGFASESQLMTKIYDAPGGMVLYEGTAMTDESGFAFIGFDVHGANLQVGQYIVVSDGAATKELELELITFDTFDLDANVAAGTAPPGRLVRVTVATSPEAADQMSAEVTADPNSGAWEAGFGDITEEMRGWSFAQIFDEDGDTNEAGPPPAPEPPAPEEQWVWAYTYDLPAGSWSEGEHSYAFEMTSAAGGGTAGPRGFTVSSQAGLYEGSVLLDPWSSQARSGETCAAIDSIHPDQPTRFRWGWLTDEPLTYDDAVALYESMQVFVSWDSGAAVEMVRRELLEADSVDWASYICGMTLP